jgi:hypothetical protein
VPRRRLTAQDAFLGVRDEPPAEELPLAGPAPTPEPVSQPAEEGRRPAATPAPREVPAPARPRVGERAAARPDREFAAALQAAQAAMAARAAIERLTLYLPPDLSGSLQQLWQEVREGANVKVGKSVLAGAALRIVLANPALRAQAAATALREKLGSQESA